ncbi:DUF3605 domain-containing protein [Chloropicon roscoffensis]|uniref:DUF3605 domain-containing protein n=1 Tax=Chloropicon roscoffensis TaxID=1461544 RepID=A0AAX4PCS3_9CHLO
MVRCETTLKSWGELQDIVRRSKERAENQGILGNLRRLKADQDEYDAFLKVVQEEWKSLDDFILHKVFGCERRSTTDDGGTIRSTCDKPAGAERLLKWAENDFPYALEKNIRHYLLWSTKELSTDELSQQVADFVDTEQYVYFVNPPHLRSVRKVWHAHVLFKIEGK